MRIFVYEHVTGGGMAGQPLPSALLDEADRMVQTLIAELLQQPGVELHTTRDARLTPVPGLESGSVKLAGDSWQTFVAGVRQSDAVWPTAPETDGALEQLSREVQRQSRVLLGCRPEAVHIAASKRNTSLVLAASGVPVVATYSLDDPPNSPAGCWVTKPDDGAGSTDTLLHQDWGTAAASLRSSPGRLVAQPWLDGTAVSLSLLCREGTSRFLCANRQRIRIEGGAMGLEGIAVNAIPDSAGTLACLGRQIAAALPGLWGYVGIDLVLTERGPVVLEINPRLTTSFAGIHAALGISVAAEVLELLNSPTVTDRQAYARSAVVELSLEGIRGH